MHGGRRKRKGKFYRQGGLRDAQFLDQRIQHLLFSETHHHQADALPLRHRMQAVGDRPDRLDRQGQALSREAEVEVGKEGAEKEGVEPAAGRETGDGFSVDKA